jgi:DNA-binding NarL/FixJ family response regulator
MLDPYIASESDSVQLTVNSYRQLLQNTTIAPARIPKQRKSRAKRNQAWEELDKDSGGMYSAYLYELQNKYPMLTHMEAMVAALIKGTLQSHEISQRLAIQQKTVENHRHRIRRKLGLGNNQNLQIHLGSQR